MIELKDCIAKCTLSITAIKNGVKCGDMIVDISSCFVEEFSYDKIVLIPTIIKEDI